MAYSAMIPSKARRRVLPTSTMPSNTGFISCVFLSFPPGLPDGAIVVGYTVPEGWGVVVPDGEADGRGVWDGLIDGDGLQDGDGEGEGDGTGMGACSTGSFIRNTRLPSVTLKRRVKFAATL